MKVENVWIGLTSVTVCTMTMTISVYCIYTCIDKIQVQHVRCDAFCLENILSTIKYYVYYTMCTVHTICCALYHVLCIQCTSMLYTIHTLHPLYILCIFFEILAFDWRWRADLCSQIEPSKWRRPEKLRRPQKMAPPLNFFCPLPLPLKITWFFFYDLSPWQPHHNWC